MTRSDTRHTVADGHGIGASLADPIRTLLERLDGVKSVGPGKWMARCPAHVDKHASLSIGIGTDGHIVIYDHAGCAVEAIVAAIGLTMAHLFVPTASGNGHGRYKLGPIVAIYKYCDADGRIIAEKTRHTPKDFRWRRPDGNGGHISGRGAAEIPLYNLPAILNHREDRHEDWIVLVEGEKDADNASKLGFTSTTSPDGASKDAQRPKWRDGYSETLAGLKVVVICDADAAGAAHGDNAARSLSRHAAEVRTIHAMPGGAKDASEWIEAGGTAEQLREVIEAAPVWKSADQNPCITAAAVRLAHVRPGPVLIDMSEVKREQVNWLWRSRIPVGRITVLAGPQGKGKSFVTTDLTARITTGSPWPDDDEARAPIGSVLMIVAEDHAGDTIGPRLDAAHADTSPGKVKLLSVIRRIDPVTNKPIEFCFTLVNIKEMRAAMESMPDLKLVIIDPIGSFIGGKTDAHRDNEVRSVLGPIAKLAEQFGVAMLLVMHVRKAHSNSADETVLGSVAFTALARSVLHLSEDKTDRKRKLLLPGKMNLTAQPDGLAFIIDGDPPSILWEKEPVKMHADDAIADNANPGPEPQARHAAEEWLQEVLAGGPVPSGDLKNPEAGSIRAMAKEAGLAWPTIRRAADHLGIKCERCQFTKKFTWRLRKGT